MARFESVDDQGHVLGGRRPAEEPPRKAYQAWIDYFYRKMADDAWSDVEGAVNRRGGNFSVRLGGHLLEAPVAGWRAELDNLYAALVRDDHAAASESPTRRLREVVLRVLHSADVDPQPDFTVPAKYGQRSGTARFDFAYQNGQLHLMKALSLSGGQGQERALAFNARVRAAADAGAASSFLAFYDSTSGVSDEVLAPVEGVALAIDVHTEDEAVQAVRDLVSH